MAYTALYRKFRPTTFSEVKGQDAIVTTLRNQVISGRVGHAYLFCGTRGTGKTTLAKIMAKSVNCEHPVNGEACGCCESCRVIEDGSAIHVIEIDAASNNGVDNIREIREEVAYSPTIGKYKVYIIDEVHMLSPGAFNALLKTLEEPPSYVIFILATTEARKLPQTILSRCQRYDFRRIDLITIKDRLAELLERENILAEEDALRYIARLADGSMRDSLSLLEQCLGYYPDEPVTYRHVIEVMGAVDPGVYPDFLKNMLAGDVSACLELLDMVLREGRELSVFVNDFIWYLRNLMLAKSMEDDANAESVLEMSKEQLKELRDIGTRIDLNSIYRYIRVFSELVAQLRQTEQKRITLETCVVRLCNPEMDEDLDSLKERIRVLEKKVRTLEKTPRTVVAGTMADGVPGNTKTSDKPIAKPTLKAAVPAEVEKLVRNFDSLLKEMKPTWRRYLEDARLSLSDAGNLLIVFTEGTGKEYFERDAKELEAFLSGKVGAKIRVEFDEIRNTDNFSDIYADLKDKIKMPITIEGEE